ncbi:MAG: hypothetical protein ABI158_06365 [Edaphobacter sp.]
MREPYPISAAVSEPASQPPALSARQGHAQAAPPDLRTMELEMENLRLQRLVAELLLKNQQLRRDQE